MYTAAPPSRRQWSGFLGDQRIRPRQAPSPCRPWKGLPLWSWKPAHKISLELGWATGMRRARRWPLPRSRRGCHRQADKPPLSRIPYPRESGLKLKNESLIISIFEACLVRTEMATAEPFEPDLGHPSEGTVCNVTLSIHLSAPGSPHHD